MNDITIKCTRYAEIENDFIKFYIKDVDDNQPIQVIQNLGPNFDSITCIDKDAVVTKFYICKIQGTEPPIQDGDWKVNQFIVSYSHKETL